MTGKAPSSNPKSQLSIKAARTMKIPLGLLGQQAEIRSDRAERFDEYRLLRVGFIACQI
jgi:hypothetical protein